MSSKFDSNFQNSINNKIMNKNQSCAIINKTNETVVADMESKIMPQQVSNPDARLQISTTDWLNKFGLRANGLDSLSLFPKLGFPRIEDFNKALQKPIHSRYGDNLFPRHFREDGITFNIVAKKEKLLNAQQQLANAVQLYEQRLQWLSSESRRIFGVIEEHCISIILDVKSKNSREFDQFLCAIERLIKEQLKQCLKFNMFRAQDVIYQFGSTLIPVTKDSINAAVDWIWKIERTKSVSSANLVEALIRATHCKETEAIYLITESNSSDGSREVLREKVKQMSIPLNIITYNCNDADLLKYFCDLTLMTNGKLHTYTFNLEMPHYEVAPLPTEQSPQVPGEPIASLLLKKRVYGGSVGGPGTRKDCMDLFSELEEARLILSQITSIIKQIPEKRTPYDEPDDILKVNERLRHPPREEYMSSQEWLARFGLAARKLDLYDVLGGVCFKHCDGVINVLEPPPPDKLDLMEQQDATSHQKLINAIYCDKFAHVRWKDGSLVHVQMSADVHRLYAERMSICLSAIRRRIEWLRQGSRELFGTIMEDQIYILIDTSASMEPHMSFVKDKLYSLIQEQLRHKSKVNFVAFNNKALPWRDKVVEVTEDSLKSAWRWLEGLICAGSTNTQAALQCASRDANCQAVYILTDGRPDQPPATILAQMRSLRHNRRLPIHCISFNCNDSEANSFLSQLARETGGRFHYFNEADGGANIGDMEGNSECPELDVSISDAWESEDIRLLKAEYRLGNEFLDKVTKLRDECHRLAWKKEVEKKKLSGVSQGGAKNKPTISFSESNKTKRIKSVLPTLGSPASPTRANKRITARNTLQQELLKSKDPKAYHEFLQTLNNQDPEKQEWLLKETQDILDRQTERYQKVIGDEIKEVEELIDKSKKKPKCKELNLKQWLGVYGLVPQHMTILDALAPTVIKVSPAYVPIIDRYVVSKVFDDILPISHVVSEGSHKKGYRPVIRLVNPIAVDLKKYRENLNLLLNKYQKKLIKLIRTHLGEKIVAEFKDIVEEHPMGTEELHRWVIEIFEAADWPVCEDHLEMFMKEINIGHKYLQQAQDLIDNRYEAPVNVSYAEAADITKRPSSKSRRKTKKANKKSNNWTESSYQREQLIDPFNTMSIYPHKYKKGDQLLVPNESDGYFYEGTVGSFNEENYTAKVWLEMYLGWYTVDLNECVKICDPPESVKPGLKCLVKVLNVDNQDTFYLPAIVLSPFSIDPDNQERRCLICLYNGIESNIRPDEMVLIDNALYNKILANIQDKVVSQSGYDLPNSSLMATTALSIVDDTVNESQMSKEDRQVASHPISRPKKMRSSKSTSSKNLHQKTKVVRSQNTGKKEFNIVDAAVQNMGRVNGPIDSDYKSINRSEDMGRFSKISSQQPAIRSVLESVNNKSKGQKLTSHANVNRIRQITGKYSSLSNKDSQNAPSIVELAPNELNIPLKESAISRVNETKKVDIDEYQSMSSKYAKSGEDIPDKTEPISSIQVEKVDNASDLNASSKDSNIINRLLTNSHILTQENLQEKLTGSKSVNNDISIAVDSVEKVKATASKLSSASANKTSQKSKVVPLYSGEFGKTEKTVESFSQKSPKVPIKKSSSGKLTVIKKKITSGNYSSKVQAATQSNEIEQRKQKPIYKTNSELSANSKVKQTEIYVGEICKENDLPSYVSKRSLSKPTQSKDSKEKLFDKLSFEKINQSAESSRTSKGTNLRSFTSKHPSQQSKGSYESVKKPPTKSSTKDRSYPKISNQSDKDLTKTSIGISKGNRDKDLSQRSQSKSKESNKSLSTSLRSKSKESDRSLSQRSRSISKESSRSLSQGSRSKSKESNRSLDQKSRSQSKRSDKVTSQKFKSKSIESIGVPKSDDGSYSSKQHSVSLDDEPNDVTLSQPSSRSGSSQRKILFPKVSSTHSNKSTTPKIKKSQEPIKSLKSIRSKNTPVTAINAKSKNSSLKRSLITTKSPASSSKLSRDNSRNIIRSQYSSQKSPPKQTIKKKLVPKRSTSSEIGKQNKRISSKLKSKSSEIDDGSLRKKNNFPDTDTSKGTSTKRDKAKIIQKLKSPKELLHQEHEIVNISVSDFTDLIDSAITLGTPSSMEQQRLKYILVSDNDTPFAVTNKPVDLIPSHSSPTSNVVNYGPNSLDIILQPIPSVPLPEMKPDEPNFELSKVTISFQRNLPDPHSRETGSKHNLSDSHLYVAKSCNDLYCKRCKLLKKPFHSVEKSKFKRTLSL